MNAVRRAVVVLLAAGLLAVLLAGPHNDAPSTPAPIAAAAHTDFHGDPLPDGAIARLGTVRFACAHSIRGLAYSPDGKLLAGADGYGSLSLWDAKTGHELRRLDGSPETFSFTSGILFSPDGKRLAEVDDNARVHIWDVAAGKPLAALDGKCLGRRMAFSPDGKKLLMCGGSNAGGQNSKNARLWDTATGKELLNLSAAADGFVAYSPDGAAVATGHGNSITLQDPESGKRLWDRGNERGEAYALAFSPDGKILAAGDGNDLIGLWDVATGTKVRRLVKEGYGATRCIYFSPDGKTLITGGLPENTFAVWDVSTGAWLCRLELPCVYDEACALSPDGKTLAVGYANRVCFGRVAGDQEPSDWPANQEAVALSPDGRKAVTAGYRNHYKSLYAVQLWDARSGRLLREWEHAWPIQSLVFSPTGRRFAVTPGMGEVWDVDADRNPVRSVGGFGDALAFTPDGKPPVTTYEQNPAFAEIDFLRGQVRRSAALAIPYPYVNATPSLDCRLVVAGRLPVGRLHKGGPPPDGELVGLWDAATGAPIRKLGGLPKKDKDGAQGVAALRFSNDGRALAWQDTDGVLHIWRTDRNKESAHFPSPIKPIKVMAFSPDGRLLALGGNDDRLHIVEPAGGGEAVSYPGHRGGVRSVAFSADGTTVAAAGEDCTVLVWDVAGRRREDVAFTPDELNALWTDLAGDAGKAFAAQQALTGSPRQSAPFLLKRIRASWQAVAPQRLARLLADLDSDSYEEREHASAELAKLGSTAESGLLEARKSNPSPEVARRTDELLANLDDARPSPEEMRVSRAIAALECADTDETRQVLEKLAKGPPGSPPTENAKAALARRARLPAAP